MQIYMFYFYEHHEKSKKELTVTCSILWINFYIVDINLF